MAPRPNPNVVSVYKKYTKGSTGIWERIRRFFAVDPNRSTGIPYVPLFRNPTPGVLPGPAYHDPVTIPAGDIAGNPYWKRDVRRDYPRLSVISQNDAAAMLLLGTASAPQIADGDAGSKQLVEFKSGGQGLAEMIKKVGHAAVLGPDGMPPLPGKGQHWQQKMGDDAPYPDG